MVQQSAVRPAAEGAVRRPGRSLWWEVPAGLVVGAGWGLLARGWMRYISDEPEFSWAGTLFIVGAFALAGTFLALVDVLRRRRARAWRVLLSLPALLLFASPGMLMLAPTLLGGFALCGRGPRWLRVVVGSSRSGGAGAGARAGPPVRRGRAVPGYLLLCAGLAAGWSLVMRPRPHGEGA